MGSGVHGKEVGRDRPAAQTTEPGRQPECGIDLRRGWLEARCEVDYGHSDDQGGGLSTALSVCHRVSTRLLSLCRVWGWEGLRVSSRLILTPLLSCVLGGV